MLVAGFQDQRRVVVNVDKVRLYLCTAANNWPVVYPPGMESHCGMIFTGRNPDSSTRALWQFYPVI
jgi:hypothetical protein